MYRDIICTICVIKDALNISRNYRYEWLREIKRFRSLNLKWQLVISHPIRNIVSLVCISAIFKTSVCPFATKVCLKTPLTYQ